MLIVIETLFRRTARLAPNRLCAKQKEQIFSMYNFRPRLRPRHVRPHLGNLAPLQTRPWARQNKGSCSTTISTPTINNICYKTDLVATTTLKKFWHNLINRYYYYYYEYFNWLYWYITGFFFIFFLLILLFFYPHTSNMFL